MRYLAVILATLSFTSCKAAEKGESKSEVTINETGEQVRKMTIQVHDMTLDGLSDAEGIYSTAQGLDEAGNVIPFADGKSESTVKISPVANWIVRDDKYYADLWRFQVFEFDIPYSATNWKIDLSKFPGRTCDPGSASGKVADVPDVTDAAVQAGNGFYVTGNCTVSYGVKMLSGKISGLNGELTINSGKNHTKILTGNGEEVTFELETDEYTQTKEMAMSAEELTEFSEKVKYNEEEFIAGGKSTLLQAEVKIVSGPDDQSCTVTKGIKILETVYSRYAHDHKTDYYNVAGSVFYRKFGPPVADDLTIACIGKKVIGGTVTSLEGTSVTLKLVGSNEEVVVDGNKPFTFSAKLNTGSSYEIVVSKQPGSSESCTVTNGTGTVADEDITNVTVNCISQYTLSVTISGIDGKGTYHIKDQYIPNFPTMNLTEDGTYQFPTQGEGHFVHFITGSQDLVGVTCAVGDQDITMSSNTNVAITCTPVVP